MNSDSHSHPEFQPDGLVHLGAAANLAARYAEEGREFVYQLAAMLEGSLGEEATVERRGGLFGPKTVSQITLRFSNWTYGLEVPKNGDLIASRVKVVRGIALKTEVVPVEAWLHEIGRRLQERAANNRETSQALERLTNPLA